jgi:hypothetical protein
MEISEHLRGTAAPFGIVTDESTAVGSQAGLQGTWGQVYGEVVYRYLLLDGRRDRHDLSEGYLHFRTRGGDLVVGRQHLFIGPVQNNRLGSLLKLEAADAVVYQAPLRRGYRQEAGYLIDSRATRRRGYSGGYLRGQAPVRAGYAGYSVLFADTGNSRIGWSLDASQPVIPNVLDLYGEGGVGIHGRTLWTAGIYVPALYHAGKVDLFLEYSGRENSDDRASLRLRRELGSGLFVAAFADRRLRQNEWDVGAGIQWNLRYR